MKTRNYYLLGLGVIFLFSCAKAEQKNELPTVDVTKTYPKKEIVLQDIAEVDYVPLETRDDVLIDGDYRLCVISQDSLLVGNATEGTLFLFNGKGKFLQKFKNKGQSGKEYSQVWGLYYDKPTHEIIILDYMMKYQFQVYDEKGNYKRTIPIPKKYLFLWNEVVNYDANTLLCYKDGVFSNLRAKSNTIKKQIKPYFFLSKKDGKELEDLPILLSEKVERTIESKTATTVVAPIPFVEKGDGFILSELGKDTIFLYSNNKKLTPIVARTPKILKMEEPLVFLQIEKLTPKYIFGKLTKKTIRLIKKGSIQYPKFMEKRIVIDRSTNAIYECNLINKDITKTDKDFKWFAKNDQSMLLGADMLKKLLEEGKLQGGLKEIVANMREDDNPVWVRIKFKK